MEIIAKGHKRLVNILGQQTYYPNSEYRQTNYKKVVKTDDGILVENTLTRQIVLLSESEYESCPEDIKKYLVQNWFLLPDDVSEKSLWYGLRNSYLSKYNRNQNGGVIDFFTIFTTLECNARCPYCYEAGRKQTVMTQEMALEVAQYVNKARGSNSITFGWFGGEPLVNSEIIDTICQYMLDNKIPYKSNIISNGYLFGQISDEQIVDIWKLKQAQITLDGTADVYNSVKGYIDNPENAFETVIASIKRLTNLGIHVRIRLNQSDENYKNLIELTGYLAERFKGNDKVVVYAHPLFEDCTNVLSDAEWAKTYNGYIELNKALKAAGLRPSRQISEVRINNCMADSGRNICISPEGNLTLCEHYSDTEVVGNIWDGITDTALVEQWRELADEKEECQTCWYYPKCLRLKKCDVRNDCDHGANKFYAYQEDESILKVYENYLNKKEQETKEEVVSESFDASLLTEAAMGELGKSLEDRNYWQEIFPNVKERGWCLPFIYTMFKQAYGDDNLGTLLCLKQQQLTQVPHLLAKHYKRIGRLHDTPEIGDIVFYRIKWSSHAGIVVSIAEDGTTFNSVEGNVKKDDKTIVCQLKNVPVSGNEYLVGFGRPKWS